MVGIHQNPLDQIIAVLVASNIDERNAWTIWMSCGDDSEISIKEFDPTNLETLLDDFGSKLVNAVAVRVGKNVIDNSAPVCRRTMFAEMLDAPITELAMSNEIDACDNFFDSRTLKID